MSALAIGLFPLPCHGGRDRAAFSAEGIWQALCRFFRAAFSAAPDRGGGPARPPERKGAFLCAPRSARTSTWGAATVAPDMALVRAPADPAGKRKTGMAEGQTSLRRRERRASSTARAFAAAAAPRSTRRPSSAGAHLAGPPAGGGQSLCRPGSAKKPLGREQRCRPSRSSPTPRREGGGRIFASGARGGGHDERPSLETAGPAALAPATGGAHTTGTRRTTHLGRRGGRRGGAALARDCRTAGRGPHLSPRGTSPRVKREEQKHKTQNDEKDRQ